MSHRARRHLAASIHPRVSPARAALSAQIKRNSATSLGRYFRRLARASMAAGLLAGAGCASSFPQTPGEDGFLPAECGDDTYRTALVQDITPTDASYDYLAAYAFEGFSPEAAIADAVGARCGGATDANACDASVAESTMIYGQHLVTTSGDDVRRYETHEDLIAFLGTIDTAQEALLVAWHAGYNIGCEDITRGAVRELVGGWEVVATRMTMDCDPVETTTYLLNVGLDGELTVVRSEVTSSSPGVCVGRRPAGLAEAEGPEASSKVGAFFAEIAHLEASAVIAFRVLAHELHAHGAPRELVRAARDAAEDEVRHATAMTALARRCGAEPASVVVESKPLRSLFEIALDNAAEGCVRETFGAMVGTHQAAAAEDPVVKATLAEIADDETRHAALSWSIAEWIEARLSPEEQNELRAIRARAIVELRAEMSSAPDPELVRVAGIPTADAAIALIDQMVADVWAEDAA